MIPARSPFFCRAKAAAPPVSEKNGNRPKLSYSALLTLVSSSTIPS